jgi:serine palmitoyltransferase
MVRLSPHIRLMYLFLVSYLFQIIMGEDGTDVGLRKIQALRDNANYMRMSLHDMGLEVLGQYDSPVIPIMIYKLTSLRMFSMEAYKRGLAIVIVSRPAVPLYASRVRICMSSSFTRKDLDDILCKIRDICLLVDAPGIKRS